MGCILRALAISFLVGGSLLFGIGFLGMSALTSESRDAVAKIRATPVKRFADVFRADGPAWVKVKIQPLSASDTLHCGSEECLYLQRRFFQNRVNDIKRAGSWTHETRATLIRDERKDVPIALVDDSGQVSIHDWLGVEVWPDLLRMRRFNPGIDAEGIASADTFFWGDPEISSLSDSAQAGQMASLIASGEVTVQEAYLPVNVDAWALGKFEDGKPQVFVKGKFYLTGLGPENFANTISERAGLLQKIRLLCGFLAIIFPLVGAYFLLKRRD